ncbi:hypothetical protein IH781_02745, partial [Patescibacteria group bacterium]|nr:hypothetical protein [Patescibacteria group bacterium]
MASANLLMALIVIRRNKRSATNVLFALLSIALATWATVNFISFDTANYQIALWMIRLVFASAFVQSVLFALLLYTVPRRTIPIKKGTLILIGVLTAAAVGSTLSPWQVTYITCIDQLPPQPTFGLGMILFVPVTLGSLITGIVLLIRNNLKARGLERIQQRYILIGLLTTFSLFIYFLLYLSVVQQNTQFVPYGPLFILPFVILTSYSIVRFRLMDVRAAIARSVSLSILIGVFVGLYSAILIWAVPLLAELFKVQASIIAAIGALLAVLLARYAQEFLRKYTDRFLFQRKISYSQALVTSGRSLSQTILIEEVTSTVLSIMRDTVRTKKGIIFLHSP